MRCKVGRAAPGVVTFVANSALSVMNTVGFRLRRVDDLRQIPPKAAVRACS